MFAHAFLPPIPPSLLPVIVQEVGHLIPLMVCQHLEILSQLLPSALRCAYGQSYAPVAEEDGASWAHSPHPRFPGLPALASPLQIHCWASSGGSNARAIPAWPMRCLPHPAG